MPRFSYGVDVEFPVFDDMSTDSNNIVPAHLIIKEGKDAPRPLVHYPGAVAHWDNVALEIASPVHFAEKGQAVSWKNLSSSLLNAAENLVYDALPGKQLVTKTYPNWSISAAMEDAHPELIVFGCDPDFNVYTGKQNKSPSIHSARGKRTFSGHMHFGFVDPEAFNFDKENKEHYHALVSAMDVIVGIELKLLKALDVGRMHLYGKPGDFRYKPEYPGIEYRVPSNEWVSQVVSSQMSKYNLAVVANNWKLFYDYPEFQELAYDAANLMAQPDSERLNEKLMIHRQFSMSMLQV